MTHSLDILVRRARLREYPDRLMDIGISSGRIAMIEGEVTLDALNEIDAGENLVTESYVNPHLHLCKVYTLGQMDEKALEDYHGADMGRAMTAIESAARVKERYEESWIIENARHAVALAARYGNTHIRAFADVDTKACLEGVKALIKVREEFKGVVDIQVVAFPQDGLVREPGAIDLIREAMELGADVVGGIPWIEYTDAACQRHVDEMFKIAVEYNKPVSMLVDDAGDPGLRTLEMLVLKTIETGWHGRSLAHHARAMQLYPRPYFHKVAALLKAANMGIVSDPHTGPLHASVKDLLGESVLVCLGQDDISDAYYPFGRNNMLEVAFLASHMLWMTTAAEMERLYDMVTVNAAQAMGIQEFGIKVGAPAHLVVLHQSTVLDALRYHEAPAHVISHGRLIDKREG